MKYLLQLYGDESPDPEPDQQASTQDGEERALENLKRLIDQRERPRPPSSTIDAIESAARSAAASSARAADRLPARGRRRFALPMGVLGGAVLIIALVFTLNDQVVSPLDDVEAYGGIAESPLAESPPELSDLAVQQEAFAVQSGQLSSDPESRAVRRSEGEHKPEAAAPHTSTRDASAAGPNESERRPDYPDRRNSIAADELARSSLQTRRGAQGTLDFDLEGVDPGSRLRADRGPAAAMAAAMTANGAVDLEWDDSEDVRALYREVMQLDFVSPSGGHWRPMVADPLVTPIGVSRSHVRIPND